MKMKKIITVIILAFAINTVAQVPEWQWAGIGYVGHKLTGPKLSQLTYKISGGFSGGYAGNLGNINYNYTFDTLNFSYTPPPPAYQSRPVSADDNCGPSAST